MITRILPTPAHVEVLSGREFTTHNILRTNRLDDILTVAEQQRFKQDLNSIRFREEGYVARVQQNGILLYASSQAGLYYGTKTIDKLIRNSEGRLSEILIVDYPAFAIRGFMEGYTGYPWTMHREEIIERCANFGFNTYVLGPNEVNLLTKWREEFPKDYRDHLLNVAAKARLNFVNFAYKVIPFGIDMSSQLDIEAFKRKTVELAELGVKAVVIGLDDFFRGQTAEAHAKAHAKFANKTAEELNKHGVLVYLIPAIYHGENKYLAALGKELDESVQVGWTGRKIVSPEVTLSDAVNLEGILKRKPFLGHNFPVVNETDRKRIIYLGPLKGIDPNLADHLNGISFNFMPLPFASLIAGLTCVDYAWNPQAYVPETSIRNSCIALGSLDLLKLVEFNPETSADPKAVHPITHIVTRRGYHRALSDMLPEQRKQLKEAFAAMSTLIYSLLPPKIDSRLYDDLKPLLYQATVIGGLGEAIVDGNISNIGFRTRIYGAVKMIGGYRFSGVEIENWILREMGFPTNMMPNLRILSDVKDRILRGRHKRQKV